MGYEQGAYYWVQLKEGGIWHMGEYAESRGGIYRRFYLCGVERGVPLAKIYAVGPRVKRHVGEHMQNNSRRIDDAFKLGKPPEQE